MYVIVLMLFIWTIHPLSTSLFQDSLFCSSNMLVKFCWGLKLYRKGTWDKAKSLSWVHALLLPQALLHVHLQRATAIHCFLPSQKSQGRALIGSALTNQWRLRTQSCNTMVVLIGTIWLWCAKRAFLWRLNTWACSKPTPRLPGGNVKSAANVTRAGASVMEEAWELLFSTSYQETFTQDSTTKLSSEGGGEEWVFSERAWEVGDSSW